MKKLYVGNLSYDINQDSLEKMFTDFGSVSSAIIITEQGTGRSKGFGFVEMENSDDADKAIKELHDKEIQGRKLCVNEARPKKPSNFGGGGGGGRGGDYRRR